VTSVLLDVAPQARTRSGVRQRLSPVAKRTVDLVGALVLLVLVSPVMLAIAALIVATDGRPVLFAQERVGRGGRTFRMYKFRTMWRDNDDSAHREQNRRELAGEAEVGADGTYKDRHDPRIMKGCSPLRRYSLDELPQLLNVLRGDMSLVGPRPALPWEAELFEPRYRERDVVRPGMTGLWQVSGRSELSMREMLELDVAYVRRRSALGDLVILLRTPLVVFTAEGAS
jgi:lipopolysaccharide/colanic/teichoic acid biosynthesis glycosyltransferase